MAFAPGRSWPAPKRRRLQRACRAAGGVGAGKGGLCGYRSQGATLAAGPGTRYGMQPVPTPSTVAPSARCLIGWGLCANTFDEIDQLLAMGNSRQMLSGDTEGRNRPFAVQRAHLREPLCVDTRPLRTEKRHMPCAIAVLTHVRPYGWRQARPSGRDSEDNQIVVCGVASGATDRRFSVRQGLPVVAPTGEPRCSLPLQTDSFQVGIASPGDFIGDTLGLAGAREIDYACFHGRGLIS